MSSPTSMLMLAALRVHDTAQFLRSASKKPKSEPKGCKPPKRERDLEPAVLRSSLRIRGLSPQSIGDLGSESPLAKAGKDLMAPSPGFPKRLKPSKKGPLSFAETYVPYGEEVTYDHYLNRIRELSNRELLAEFTRAKPGRGSEVGGHVGPKYSPGDLGLKAKDIVKVTPRRIFSVHILPCRERVIVASGDKEGHLSLWDADCEQEEGNGLQIYMPYAATVSGIATVPFSVEKLFSLHAERFLVACIHSAAQHSDKERRTKPLIYARPASDYHHDGEGYDFNNCISDSGHKSDVEKYQIFVKTFSGKSMLVWVTAQDTGESLKTLIMQKEGYSPTSFYILHEGKVLNEGDRLRDCQIYKNYTLHVMYRLWGGKFGNRGTVGPSSYKDAARSKGPQSSADPPSQQPKPYIVEKLDDIPSLEVKNTEVTQLFSTLQTHALICRFNGFWPRSYDLHN